MTRELMVALVMAVASLGRAQAQSTTETRRSGDVTQALVDRENRWADALVKSDITALNAILADTFVDTDEEGHQSDKRSVLAALTSGDLKMSSIKLSDMHVHAYANSAVVTGKAAQLGAFKGQSLEPTIVFTDTFVLQRGKWRAVASHRSAVHN